jgi:AcrR family transcriptional regulator
MRALPLPRDGIRAGRPPKQQAQALGDHVVAIADALFIERGYGGTSMATVAARARVGKQTLYRRFPDKAALFREVIRRRIDAMIPARGPEPDHEDPLHLLKRMGASALTTVLDTQFVPLYRIVVAEAPLFPELAGTAADYWGSTFGDRCIDLVRRAQAIGRCRAGDPEELAQNFLWSLVGGPLHTALSGQPPLPGEGARRAHLETAWAVFERGITP